MKESFTRVALRYAEEMTKIPLWVAEDVSSWDEEDRALWFHVALGARGRSPIASFIVDLAITSSRMVSYIQHPSQWASYGWRSPEAHVLKMKRAVQATLRKWPRATRWLSKEARELFEI